MAHFTGEAYIALTQIESFLGEAWGGMSALVMIGGHEYGADQSQEQTWVEITLGGIAFDFAMNIHNGVDPLWSVIIESYSLNEFN